MRNLHEDATAVAELGIGADGAAMVEIEQDAQSHFDDRLRLFVAHIGDEADAAGIMLLGGIVEALRRRKSGIATERLRSGFSDMLGGFRHLSVSSTDRAPLRARLPPPHRTIKLSQA